MKETDEKRKEYSDKRHEMQLAKKLKGQRGDPVKG